jgi:hypothetical protein
MKKVLLYILTVMFLTVWSFGWYKYIYACDCDLSSAIVFGLQDRLGTVNKQDKKSTSEPTQPPLIPAPSIPQQDTNTEKK